MTKETEIGDREYEQQSTGIHDILGAAVAWRGMLRLASAEWGADVIAAHSTKPREGHQFSAGGIG